MSKVDKALFDGLASKGSYGSCPDCKGELLIKNGKNGPFIGCKNYPACEFIKPLTDTSVDVIKNIDESLCPKCNEILQIKKGRFGLFIGCSAYPSCDYISSTQAKTETQVTCPLCKKGQLMEKTNRYGKRFFSCTDYPSCRYVVNFAPIPKACPECDWPILIKKSGQYHCPQKTCRYIEDESIK